MVNTETMAFGLLVILAGAAALWLVSLRRRDASIIDVFWGPGFVLAAWLYFCLTPDGFLPRQLLVATLVTIWGLRLGLHLGWRNRITGEDDRYRRWRESHGAKWWWHSLFKVFLLQGVVLWLIAMPLLAALTASAPAHLTWLDIAGSLIWAIGLFFEAVGDWQLARFKANPRNRGQVMRAGLWQYTRHPNYFGDALVWWGYFVIALAVPGGWQTLFSPLLMTFLLRRVSGVALLERALKQTKPAYADYMATTSAFVPRCPRK